MKTVYLCPARMLRSGKISFEALSSLSTVRAETPYPFRIFPQRFAAAHLARFGAVVVGVDAVNDILRRGFFLFGRGLLRSSVARPCGYEQQGAYR